MRTQKPINGKIATTLQQFKQEFTPLESEPPILIDKCTRAKFCECHIKAKTLVNLGTPIFTLNPADKNAFPANRETELNSDAFLKMRADAKKGRSFSNIVTEYRKEPGKPSLKVIGGQHRFAAIQEALAAGQDQYHGIKVYFDLTMQQRLDVQLISNTNISISKDLIDRMLETVRGPQLLNWCHSVGLLKSNEDFTAKHKRSGPISVRLARTFIVNFYLGQQTDEMKFVSSDTTPTLSKTGKEDLAWSDLLNQHPTLWKDSALRKAAEEFAALIEAQRKAVHSLPNPPTDWAEKTLNPAVLSGWAYVAGMLQKNSARLRRHYSLRQQAGRDPLNAAELANGRHTSDLPNYRGLGNRQDPKECSRLVELFYKQSEKGHGITEQIIEIAISRQVAKRANLEVADKEAKEG